MDPTIIVAIISGVVALVIATLGYMQAVTNNRAQMRLLERQYDLQRMAIEERRDQPTNDLARIEADHKRVRSLEQGVERGGNRLQAQLYMSLGLVGLVTSFALILVSTPNGSVAIAYALLGVAASITGTILGRTYLQSYFESLRAQREEIRATENAAFKPKNDPRERRD